MLRILLAQEKQKWGRQSNSNEPKARQCSQAVFRNLIFFEIASVC